MAVVVELDRLDGSLAGSHHVMTGWALTRPATVRGLTGYTDGLSLMSAAIAAVVQVVGNRGDQFSMLDASTGDYATVYIEQFIPEVIDQNTVKVKTVYKGFPLPTYEINNCLNQVESTKSASGSNVILAHTYPKTYWNAKPAGVANRRTQGGILSRPVPEPGVTVKFMVIGNATVPDLVIDGTHFSFPGTRTPTEQATWFAAFEGCMNDSPFSFGLISGRARQWMVTSVRGITRDGGRSYEMSMTFQFRAATWDQEVFYINPDTGRPPAGMLDHGASGDPGDDGKLESGSARKIVRVAKLATYPTFTFQSN